MGRLGVDLTILFYENTQGRVQEDLFTEKPLNSTSTALARMPAFKDAACKDAKIGFDRKLSIWY